MSPMRLLVDRLRNDGVAMTLRLAVGRIRSQFVSLVEDMRRGVSTTREEPDSTLGFEDPQNHAYVATDYDVLREIMRRIDIREDDVFVDFGSGKGRAVFLAAEYPFKRVIGVEFSPQLHDVACRNLSALGAKLRCKDVELVQSDATKWEIPGNTTVMFFFNPFEGEVLKRVFDNIRKSLADFPRRITIIYVRADKFLEKEIRWTEWLTRTQEFRCSDGKVAIYESKP